MLATQYAIRTGGAPSPRRIRKWVQAALSEDAEITVRIVGAAEARALNRRFRGRDHATNVLTFVYEEGAWLRGDIALCAPVVAREARAQGKGVAAHYAHLVVHGVLHLQGYNHGTEREARVMERRERRILGRLGYPDPYRGEE